MSVTPLSAREVYQLLKDIALGEREISRSGAQRWNASYCGSLPVWVDGWQLSVFFEAGELGYCAECVASDGRVGSVDSWGRYGTDPIQLLSRWEREQLERKLQAL
ncbi:hypothetical protein ACVW0Y_003532 [Pseudomonas sp. TE3786]